MSRLPCSIEGCERQYFAKGFCKLHYDRWYRHGDPLVLLKPQAPWGAIPKWLREYADYSGDECLTWPFARYPDGRANMNGGYPTRAMCELAYGPAPSPKHEAAHSCGKGHEACVNPRHLRWATPKENAADKKIHGTHIKGEA